MLSFKHDLRFVIRDRIAKTVLENPQHSLILDPAAPGKLNVFLSSGLQEQIGNQLAKNPNLDGASFSASLLSLIDDVSCFFEDEAEIENWEKIFERAIVNLRVLKRDRRIALKCSICRYCTHRAIDHYRPREGNLGCRIPGCICVQFRSPALQRIHNDMSSQSSPPKLKIVVNR